MRYSFESLPGERRLRPIVPVLFLGLPKLVPIRGLVDSGAVGVRADSEIADALGINLSAEPVEQIAMGASTYVARFADTELQIRDMHFRWTCRVGFIDNFGGRVLLGIDGFFDRFIVRVEASRDSLDLSPSRRNF